MSLESGLSSKGRYQGGEWKCCSYNHSMQKPIQIVKSSSGRDTYLLWFICDPVLGFRKTFLATFLWLLPIAPAKLRTSKSGNCLGNILPFWVPLLKEKWNTPRSRKETEECMSLHVCIASCRYYWSLFCAFPVAFAAYFRKQSFGVYCTDCGAVGSDCSKNR